MRVFGVDPGTYRTGWGVVERRGSRLVGIAAGVVSVPKTVELPERLRRIHEGVVAAVREHEPDVFAVEDLFHAKYANAALKLGHVRGVTLLAAASAGLPVHAYPPAVVKRAVAGRGKADKQQVAQLVVAILRLKTTPPIDATDALAVAITHAQAARAQPLMRR